MGCGAGKQAKVRTFVQSSLRNTDFEPSQAKEPKDPHVKGPSDAEVKAEVQAVVDHLVEQVEKVIPFRLCELCATIRGRSLLLPSQNATWLGLSYVYLDDRLGQRHN